MQNFTQNPINTHKKPLVSIYCLSYNHKKFIAQTIEGFLAQTTSFDFEIIIHDDASNDGTQEIIKAYQSKYPHLFKAIYQEKNQYSQGINPLKHMYPLTEGQFIAFCEGDDYWGDENKLQLQVDFLLSHPEYVATFHKNTTIDEMGNFIEEMPPCLCQDISAKELQTLIRGMPTRTICMRNVIKFDDEIYNKYSRPDKILNGDTFLCSLLGNYGNAKFIEEIKPAFYRQWGGGIWSSLDPINKKFAQIKSFYYFSQYYAETHNKDLSEYFANLSISFLCHLPNFQPSSLRIGIKILFPFVYGVAKKCKNFIRKQKSPNAKSTY